MNKTLVKAADGRTYQVVNGTYYNEKTPDAVIQALETARARGQRIRIFYGDVETGRDWLEENDVCGTVGRSAGVVKIPLLIANSRSLGGASILDHCIVRIVTRGSGRGVRDIYRNPYYVTPPFPIRHYTTPGRYPFGIISHENEIARFETKERAERWRSFMRGERLAK